MVKRYKRIIGRPGSAVSRQIGFGLEISNIGSPKKRRSVFPIERKVDYETLKKVKGLPIFKEGQYKGGMVAQAEDRRIRPGGELAARTVGYLNLGSEGNEVGVEGAFDKDLAGKNGVAIKQRLTGGDWITVEGQIVSNQEMAMM